MKNEISWELDDGKQCHDCEQDLSQKVLRSAAGYYVGRACDCGPYSRDTGYYASAYDGESALIRISRGDTTDLRQGGP